jgi:hypothetical protein
LKKSAEKIPAPKAGPDVALLKVLEDGEHRRQEYLATLHPRQREALDPRG